MNKKVMALLFLMSVLVSCNFPFINEQGFEQEVATKAAQAFTATAKFNQIVTNVAATYNASVITTQPTDQISTPSPTTSVEDPKKELGQPDWRDALNNGDSFGIKAERIEYFTTMKIENGKLVFTRDKLNYGKLYWLAYPTPKDFYLEAIFETGICNGDDQYGLVFRAPEYINSPAYFFLVTCDGNFNFMKWLGESGVLMQEWERTDSINAGPNQNNTLGVWAKGSTIRLYVNGIFLKEITDDFLTGAGHIGLVYDARKTSGFTIRLDEIAYWILP